MELITLALGVTAGVVAKWQSDRRKAKRNYVLKELSIPHDEVVLRIEQKKTKHLQEKLFLAQTRLNQIEAEQEEIERLKKQLALAEAQVDQSQVDKQEVERLKEQLTLAEVQVDQLQVERQEVELLESQLRLAESQLGQLQAEQKEVERLKEQLTQAEAQVGQAQVEQQEIEHLKEQLALAEAQMSQLQVEKREVVQLRKRVALSESKLSQLESQQPTEPIALGALTEKIALDRLELIQGIEPRFARYLNKAGIFTYSDIAHSSTERLQTILTASGEQNISADVSINEWISDARIRINRSS